MTKGKPWDIEEIRQLRRLVDEGKSIEEISKIMVKTFDSIKQKMFDLKLSLKEKTLVPPKKTIFSSSKLSLPADLPNVEETLQILGAALLKSAEEGLSKEEMQRLQIVATLARTYKDAFAEYLDYRGIEERLDKLEANYAAFEKKPKDI